MRAVQLHELLRVVGRDGEHIGIALAHKAQPRRIGVTDDDPVRVMQHGAQHGADAGGPGTEDKHGVALPDLGNPGCPVAGGEYIAGKQRLPVGNPVGNDSQTLIGIRHADVLRLTAVNPAAECPAAVGISAVVDKAVLTEKAVSAERLHVDGYTVAGLDGFDCRTDLLDYADHLMADRNTGDGTRHRAVLDVQIARADARHGNAHHRVSCMRENGFRLVLQGKLTLFSISVSEHSLRLRFVKCYIHYTGGRKESQTVSIL